METVYGLVMLIGIFGVFGYFMWTGMAGTKETPTDYSNAPDDG